MAYTPTNWKDRDVENPRTYTARQNEDGSITFFDAPGEIREQGTPVNASNMNKIEEGIANSVSKTGDESILGKKIFKNALGCEDIITGAKQPINFIAVNNDIDISTIPSSRLYAGYDFRGKDNTRLAYIGVLQNDTDGRRVMQIQMHNNTVGVDLPRAKDPATKVRTATDFKPATLIYNYREGTQWCRLWSDGWLEQGGHLGGETNVNTLTFLRPFKDTQYTFIRDVFIYGSTSGSPAWNEFTYTNKATTGVQLYKTNAIIQIDWYACGYER